MDEINIKENIIPSEPVPCAEAETPLRKALIELIASKVCDVYSPNCEEYTPHTCEHCYVNGCHIGELADFLISRHLTLRSHRTRNIEEILFDYLRKSSLNDIKFKHLPLETEKRAYDALGIRDGEVINEAYKRLFN